jgi:tetratricopeptide (TPR) repeat protein
MKFIHNVLILTGFALFATAVPLPPLPLTADIAQAETPDRQEAARLITEAQTLNADGDHPEAIAKAQQALTLYQALNDRFGMMDTHSFLAQAMWLGQHQPSDAVPHFQTAIALAEELGDRVSQRRLFLKLGFVYNDLGNATEASRHIEQAIAIAVQQGLQEERQIYGFLGGIYATLEQYSEALTYYQKALALAEQMNDRSALAITWSGLGRMYLKQNQPEQALTAFQTAIAVATASDPEASPNLALEASLQSGLGEAYQSLPSPRYPEAIAAYTRAISLYQRANDPIGQRYAEEQLEQLQHQ